MRAQKNPLDQRYYRCAGRIDWTNGCPQCMVNADLIEEQVGGFLSCMELPKEWEQSAVNAVGDLVDKEHLDERIKEIQAIIERLDFRWDMGYLKQEEYVEKREQLKVELVQLQPIPQDESRLKDWKEALLIFKPDTLLRWHRQGFRLFWKFKSISFSLSSWLRGDLFTSG